MPNRYARFPRVRPVLLLPFLNRLAVQKFCTSLVHLHPPAPPFLTARLKATLHASNRVPATLRPPLKRTSTRRSRQLFRDFFKTDNSTTSVPVTFHWNWRTGARGLCMCVCVRTVLKYPPARTRRRTGARRPDGRSAVPDGGSRDRYPEPRPPPFPRCEPHYNNTGVYVHIFAGRASLYIK